MSLPINMKFEVPKLKAPAPTRNPLWPSLTPAPQPKVTLPGEKSEGQSAVRPISSQSGVSPKAREGRPAVVFTSPRRGRSRRRSLLVKLALPGIPLFAVLAFVNSGCVTEKPKVQGSVLDVGPASAIAATPSAPVPRPAAYSGPAYTVPSYSQPRYAAPQQPGPAPVPAPNVAEPVAVAPPRPAMRTYVVRSGDTLSAIARLHYGDSRKWTRIATANPNINPDALKEGQKIVVPQ